VAIPT